MSIKYYKIHTSCTAWFCQETASAVLRVVEEVYRWLPLGTVIDGKVVVVHGGVAETTDLKRIHSFSREKVGFSP